MDSQYFSASWRSQGRAIFATVLGLAVLAFQPAFGQTISSLAISPASVAGGSSSIGKVTLSAAAGSDGFTVTLTSNRAGTTVPSSVTVAAGAKTASFKVTTVPIASNESAQILAKNGSRAVAASLGVLAPVIKSFVVSPQSLRGGTNGNAEIGLSSPAPAGFTVGLTSSNAAAEVQDQATFGAGARDIGVAVHTKPVPSLVSAKLSVSLHSAVLSAPLNVTPPAVMSVSVNATTLASGRPVLASLRLAAPAPKPGVTVELTMKEGNTATVIRSTVPTGQTSVKLPITPGLTKSTQTVQVSAEVAGTTAAMANVFTVWPSGYQVAPWPALLADGQNSGRGIGFGATGVVKWRTLLAPNTYVLSQPVIGADGTVYVGSADGQFFGINPATGATKWSFTAPYNPAMPCHNFGMSCTVLTAGGTLLCENGDGFLYALDSKSGALEWQQPIDTVAGHCATVTVDANENVYVVDDVAGGSTVYSFDIGGVLLWSASYGPIGPGGSIGMPAVIGPGSAFYAMAPGGVIALNESDGIMAWESSVPPLTEQTPSLGAIGTEPTVFSVGANGNPLTAFDASSGRMIWQDAAVLTAATPFSIGYDGNLYGTASLVGSSAPVVLMAVRPADGFVLWTSSFPAFPTSFVGPYPDNVTIGGDGTIYTCGGNLYAYNPMTSAWTINLALEYPLCPMAPTIGADGTLYVVDDMGYLIAVR